MAATFEKLNPFRYRGYVWDGETELYYLQSRYYEGAIARFINADVLLESNGFCYCGDNPINRRDSTGFSWFGDTLDSVGNALEKAWDWTSQTAASVWDWATRRAEDIWDWVTRRAEDIWDWVTERAENMWDWISQAAVDVWDWTSQAAVDVWDWISSEFREGMKAQQKSAILSAQMSYNAYNNIVNGRIGMVLGLISGIGTVAGSLKSLLFATTIGSIFGSIVSTCFGLLAIFQSLEALTKNDEEYNRTK